MTFLVCVKWHALSAPGEIFICGEVCDKRKKVVFRFLFLCFEESRGECTALTNQIFFERKGVCVQKKTFETVGIKLDFLSSQEEFASPL